MQELMRQAVLEVIKRWPGCAVALAGVIALAVAGYVYADREFISRVDAEAAHEQMSAEIKQGFKALGARMDLGDADTLVRDLQGQVRTKEGEISVLDMILSEMADQNSDAGNLLRGQIFRAQQDLSALRIRLDAAIKEQDQARQAYQSSQ